MTTFWIIDTFCLTIHDKFIIFTDRESLYQAFLSSQYCHYYVDIGFKFFVWFSGFVYDRTDRTGISTLMNEDNGDDDEGDDDDDDDNDNDNDVDDDKNDDENDDEND